MKKNIKQTIVRSASPVAGKLIAASSTEEEILLKEYSTNLKGLSVAAAQELREKYGRNEISHDKPRPLYKRLIEAFVNPFTIVLFILALVSLVTDVILAPPGTSYYSLNCCRDNYSIYPALRHDWDVSNAFHIFSVADRNDLVLYDACNTT